MYLHLQYKNTYNTVVSFHLCYALQNDMQMACQEVFIPIESDKSIRASLKNEKQRHTFFKILLIIIIPGFIGFRVYNLKCRICMRVCIFTKIVDLSV